AVDRFPEAAEVGVIGDAVEHHAGRAHRKRSVDDVAVPGNPADIGSAPEDVVAPIVEYPFEGGRGPDRIGTGGVDEARWLHPRAARRRWIAQQPPQTALRPARLPGEKPPNSTECTAPIRAQPSIAAAASGIIGR